MTGRFRLIAGGAALAAVLSLPGGAAAQYDAPPRPAAYALQNVTLVGSDGSVTEGVHLVVRGGVIRVLGAGAEIPADAEVLEGDSLFVYPGLVDAQADVEHDFPEAQDRSEDEEIVSWDAPRSVSGFAPRRRVAHHLTAVGESVSSLRSAGVVAGMVHPEGGMAPGQPAVVLLRADAEEPWELVNDESAGLSMSFEAARGVYPSQLFGVIAYIRQAFIDAERYAAVRDAYRRDPTGMTAPAWDPDMEALLMASRDGVPVYFRADSDEDIRRVLDLADELGFEPVIVGGAEAWKHADELADRAVPVLVSVDFPEPDDWDPEADTAGAELDPDALREKERITAVWANAGRLEDAGVTFVLTSGGGDGELLEGARKAVEHGLSREGALRALTATPARMLGIPALARVEEGGGANFMVTDADLFDEDAGVVYTFVDGRLETGRALREEAGDGEAPASDVTGTWTGSIGAQGMSIGMTMRVEMTPEGRVSGTISVEGQGESTVRGTVRGRDVSLTIEAEGMPEPIEISGTLSEDGTEIEGGGSTPMGEMEFRVEKEPGAGGAR